MDENLSLYRIFYATATAGNISKAAEELYISQPAISKSIKKLEEILHMTLFLRNSRGVQLTEEGKILFEYVKAAFETLEVGIEQVRRIANMDTGHLRIGVSTTLCKNVLLPYLKRFIEQYPHIQISIECQSTAHTLEMLSDNRIDIGLIGKPVNNRNIDFYPVMEIEDIFVTTKTYMDHLALRTTHTGIDILHDASLMMLDKENMTRQYIDHYLEAEHIQLSHALEVSSMDLLIDFAKIGLGIACVIQEFVLDDLQEGTLWKLPLSHTIPKRTIGFAHRKNAIVSHTVQEFIDFFQK